MQTWYFLSITIKIQSHSWAQIFKSHHIAAFVLQETSKISYGGTQKYLKIEGYELVIFIPLLLLHFHFEKWKISIPQNHHFLLLCWYMLTLILKSKINTILSTAIGKIKTKCQCIGFIFETHATLVAIYHNQTFHKVSDFACWLLTETKLPLSLWISAQFLGLEPVLCKWHWMKFPICYRDVSLEREQQRIQW